MPRPRVHIIGAGISGLSAAAHLSAISAVEIVVHERGSQVGGRRRSFYDERLGLMIDGGGGGPLLASGRSTLALLASAGARDFWRESDRGIAFADMASGERWTWRPNGGRWPWWVFSAQRRPPRTDVNDYLRAWKLRGASPTAVLTDFVPAEGPAMERLWRPLCLAALNLEPARASARLVAAVLAEALAAGDDGAKLLFPSGDFARAFLEPVERHLRKRGVLIRFNRELRALAFEGERVAALEFEADQIDLGPSDAVILALPAWIAATLLPGLTAPTQFTATLTAHFAAVAPAGLPKTLGLVNGPFAWLFCHADRLIASARDAGDLALAPREAIAAEFWRAIAGLTALSDEMPRWRIVRQKRAAFAATPEQDALRPGARTAWSNLVLAGGYVRTGLPEGVESAARSGEIAARQLAAMQA